MGIIVKYFGCLYVYFFMIIMLCIYMHIITSGYLCVSIVIGWLFLIKCVKLWSYILTICLKCAKILII